MTSGVFAYNKAVFAGGAVFADSASTSKLAVEYNHTLAQGIFGSCFMMFGNEPVAAAPDPVSDHWNGLLLGQAMHGLHVMLYIDIVFNPVSRRRNLFPL